MKTLAEINGNLELFKKTYGLDLASAGQGSEMWLIGKLGVPSASNASKIVAKKGTATRETYMHELIAQVGTCLMPEINARAMEWGKDHEDAARSYYEFSTGEKTVEVPFVFKDDKFRVGISPDFLVDGKPKGGEIKCPYNSVHYVAFLLEEKVKPEWDWQVQMTLNVMGAESWDFCQFDPRMKVQPMKIVPLEANPKKQETLNDAIPQFIDDMDKLLAKAGLTFGDHWKYIATNQLGVAM